MALQFTTNIDKGNYAPSVNYGSVVRTPSAPNIQLPDAESSFNIDLRPIAEAMSDVADSEARAKVASAESALKLSALKKEKDKDLYEEQQRALSGSLSKELIDIDMAVKQDKMSPQEGALATRQVQDKYISAGLEAESAAKAGKNFSTLSDTLYKEGRTRDDVAEAERKKALRTTMSSVSPSFSYLPVSEQDRIIDNAIQNDKVMMTASKNPDDKQAKEFGTKGLTNSLQQLLTQMFLDCDKKSLKYFVSAEGQQEIHNQQMKKVLELYPGITADQFNMAWEIAYTNSGVKGFINDYRLRQIDEKNELDTSISIDALKRQQKINNNPLLNMIYNTNPELLKLGFQTGRYDISMLLSVLPYLKALKDGQYELFDPINNQYYLASGNDTEEASRFLLSQTQEASMIKNALVSSSCAAISSADMRKINQTPMDVKNNIASAKNLVNNPKLNKDVREHIQDELIGYTAFANATGQKQYPMNQLLRLAENIKDHAYANELRIDPETGELGLTTKGSTLLEAFAGEFFQGPARASEINDLKTLATYAQNLSITQKPYFYSYLLERRIPYAEKGEKLNKLTAFEYITDKMTKFADVTTKAMDGLVDMAKEKQNPEPVAKSSMNAPLVNDSSKWEQMESDALQNSTDRPQADPNEPREVLYQTYNKVNDQMTSGGVLYKKGPNYFIMLKDEDKEQVVVVDSEQQGRVLLDGLNNQSNLKRQKIEPVEEEEEEEEIIENVKDEIPAEQQAKGLLNILENAKKNTPEGVKPVYHSADFSKNFSQEGIDKAIETKVEEYMKMGNFSRGEDYVKLETILPVLYLKKNPSVLSDKERSRLQTENTDFWKTREVSFLADEQDVDGNLGVLSRATSIAYANKLLKDSRLSDEEKENIKEIITSIKTNHMFNKAPKLWKYMLRDMKMISEERFKKVLEDTSGNLVL